MRPNIKEAIDRYVAIGCPCGDFLTAVLSNDLMDAFGMADEDNRFALFDICSYVYNIIPSNCHGSRKAVKDWIAHRGQQGITETLSKGNEHENYRHTIKSSKNTVL